MQLLSLEEAWTLILDDALANSFVAPATDDLKDDHQLTCKFFLVKVYVEIVNFCFDGFDLLLITYLRIESFLVPSLLVKQYFLRCGKRNCHILIQSN